MPNHPRLEYFMRMDALRREKLVQLRKRPFYHLSPIRVAIDPTTIDKRDGSADDLLRVKVALTISSGAPLCTCMNTFSDHPRVRDWPADRVAKAKKTVTEVVARRDEALLEMSKQLTADLFDIRAL